MHIPQELERFFWNVDLKQLDTERNQRFVIERILEKGDDEAVRWLRAQYPEGALRGVVSESRRLSPKSRNYWGLTLHLWSTSNQSPKTPGAIWQH